MHAMTRPLVLLPRLFEKHPTWALILLLHVTLLTPAHARVWLVLIDGSGDAPTIQEAVIAAANNDTILVGPGTYPENVQLNSKSLTFLSQQGRDHTVIYNGLSLMNSMVRASGFTISGSGVFISSTSEAPRSFFVNCALVNGSYGVFMLPPGGSVSLDSCIVAHNGGSGLELQGYEFASASCTNSEIRDNGQDGMSGTSFFIENCVISGNGRHGVASSAGIRDFFTYRTTIRNSTIKGNGTYGLFAASGQFNGTLFEVFNSTISNNENGAMYGGWRDTGYTLEDCEVLGNGGFIADVISYIEMRRCVIRGNAGGILARPTDHVSPVSGSVTMEACTYHDNGGGISALRTNDWSQPGRVTVAQSIISNNAAGIGVCSVPQLLTLNVNCTDLFANGGPDTVCAGSGSNNFSLDPLYCAAKGELTLHASSPCAPENSPPGCGLIGALPVGCGVAGIPAPGTTPTLPDFALRVSPNPIGGNGVVEWLAETPRELRLYNALGRLVAHRDLSTTPFEGKSVRWESFVKSSELAPGVYYLEAVHLLTLARRSTRVVVLH